MIVIQRFVLSLVGAGLLACSSDSRNEPSPAQMCRSLSEECSGFKSGALNECKRVGDEGLANSRAEDACYVFYDTCIDQCRFYAEFGEGLPDAGADAGALGDSGPEPSLPRDSGASATAGDAGRDAAPSAN